MLLVFLPPNRGSLDLAAFCENINYYNTVLESDVRYFNEGGKLQMGHPTFVDQINNIRRQSWTPIEEQGEIVGFQYEAVYSGDWFTPTYNTYQQLGTLAFAGALPQVNCLNFRSQQWLYQLPSEHWNYDVTYRGVRITQEAHMAYLEPGELPNDGFISTDTKTSLYLTFTIRLA